MQVEYLLELRIHGVQADLFAGEEAQVAHAGWPGDARDDVVLIDRPAAPKMIADRIDRHGNQDKGRPPFGIEACDLLDHGPAPPVARYFYHRLNWPEAQ